MKITTGQTTATIRQTVAVTDGPVTPVPFTRAGRSMRVESVHITYRLIGDEWLVDSGYAVTVTGPVLKKDGTDSLNRHSGPLAVSRNLPQWALDIIELNRPVSSLTLPGYANHEIGDTL